MTSNKKLVIENEERLKAFWGRVEEGDIEIDAVIRVVGEMLNRNPRVRFVDRGSPRIEKGVLTGHHKRHLGRKKPYPKKRNPGYMRECVLAHLYTVSGDDVNSEVDRLIALTTGGAAIEGGGNDEKCPLVSRVLGIDSLRGKDVGSEPDYAGLFTGDLYDSTRLVSAVRTICRDPVNARCFQTLASILYEKQIVILEQWALSSATFMLVAGKVLEGHRHQHFLSLATRRP
jgi:hypothetical protein